MAWHEIPAKGVGVQAKATSCRAVAAGWEGHSPVVAYGDDRGLKVVHACGRAKGWGGCQQAGCPQQSPLGTRRRQKFAESSKSQGQGAQMGHSSSGATAERSLSPSAIVRLPPGPNMGSATSSSCTGGHGGTSLRGNDFGRRHERART